MLSGLFASVRLDLCPLLVRSRLRAHAQLRLFAGLAEAPELIAGWHGHTGGPDVVHVNEEAARQKEAPKSQAKARKKRPNFRRHGDIILPGIMGHRGWSRAIG